MDYDFMDQLLNEGCWLQTADGSNLLQPGPVTSPRLSYPSSLPPSSGVIWNSPRNELRNDGLETEEGAESQSQDQKAITPAPVISSTWEGVDEVNRILWIAPEANPGPSTPVKDRLVKAISHLRERNRERDVLIQIWVPIKKALKGFLTTVRQPHFCHPTSERLQHYRDVSEKYQFLVDETSKLALGLPGRVFLGKAPEWTPNVRLFRHEEYPRINFAHLFDVRGSIALPVFERGSGDCLGVVEIIMTTEKMDYRSEVESVCKALQSVDLRSSEIWNTSDEQVGKGSQEAILPEILNLLRVVCDAHNLPLAQTWAPCIQQGKDGCWHSDENAQCVSTVDSACYVHDHQALDFNRACSEHHLLRGQGGIVGKAFETNQPCFATDVTEFSKVDYPLSHHAKVFGLRAAIAIQLRSIYHEAHDYVLEFFLPSDIQETETKSQEGIWQSVSMLIQIHCQSLRFIAVDDLDTQNCTAEKLTAEKETKQESSSSQKNLQEKTSWFSLRMNPQEKGKEIAASLEFGKEDPRQEFNVTHFRNSDQEFLAEQVYADFRNIRQDYGFKGIVEDISVSSSGGHIPSSAEKLGEKRKTKTPKTISLEELRQYFAGSLKEAAKSMGVCPTTLKRICRQHGITRWPSRKIKKVDHSLRKLQMVIDSVQGAQGAFKIPSFYTNFPDLNSPKTPQNANQNFSMNLDNQPKKHHTAQPEGGMVGSGGSTSNSPSTSSSQTSTSGHHCFSGVARGASAEDSPGGSLKRAQSEAELQAFSKKEHNQLLERSQSNKSFAVYPLEIPTSLPVSRSWFSRDSGVFKAKATFGGEKAYLIILPNMGFPELQQEIAKQFKLEDLSKITIKYLDDDREWVLLTCDADLEECIDIYRSLRIHKIKLALSSISSEGGSVGSSGLS